MILIFDGIIFLINEITTFPAPITKITEIDITIEAFSSAVIAKAEHIPNTCIVIGLLSAKGSDINLLSLLDNKPIY